MSIVNIVSRRQIIFVLARVLGGGMVFGASGPRRDFLTISLTPESLEMDVS